MTTTGAEKAQRVNPEIVMKAENRVTRTREYFGSGGTDGSATYKDTQYNYPKRPQLDADIKYRVVLLPQIDGIFRMVK